MTTTSGSFAEFMARRLAASTAFVNGDVEPLLALSAVTSPATIFGPSGSTVDGPHEVDAINAEGASHFEPGGTNQFDVMHQDADERLAYWVGIQRSVVNVRGEDRPVPMDLRVTEIFRRDGDDWMLIHRHADRAASDVSPPPR